MRKAEDKYSRDSISDRVRQQGLDQVSRKGAAFMPKKNGEYLSILTASVQEEGEIHNMFPSPSQMVTKAHRVAIEKLEENLVGFVTMLGKVVQALPDSCGGYSIDTISFSLSVDGSGKISLVGELAAGLTSGIVITLRKEKEEHE